VLEADAIGSPGEWAVLTTAEAGAIDSLPSSHTISRATPSESRHSE
jgi:hypothetical protein